MGEVTDSPAARRTPAAASPQKRATPEWRQGTTPPKKTAAETSPFEVERVAVGTSIRPFPESEERAKQAGVQDRVKFLVQDLFKTDLGPATVITMYLLPGVTRRLRPLFLDLKPGTRIVSHDFDLEDWAPDRKTTIRKNVFLWIVPAKVAGRWQGRLELPPIERQLELEVTQRFQAVSIHARLNGVPVQSWETRLEGDRLSFVVVDSADRENEQTLYFEGRVAGDAIEGELASGVGLARRAAKWRAVRVAR